MAVGIWPDAGNNYFCRKLTEDRLTMDKVFTLTAGRMVRIIIVVAALLLTAVRGGERIILSCPDGWMEWTRMCC